MRVRALGKGADVRTGGSEGGSPETTSVNWPRTSLGCLCDVLASREGGSSPVLSATRGWDVNPKPSNLRDFTSLCPRVFLQGLLPASPPRSPAGGVGRAQRAVSPVFPRCRAGSWDAGRGQAGPAVAPPGSVLQLVTDPTPVTASLPSREGAALIGRSSRSRHCAGRSPTGPRPPPGRAALRSGPLTPKAWPLRSVPYCRRSCPPEGAGGSVGSFPERGPSLDGALRGRAALAPEPSLNGVALRRVFLAG